ncbi:MqnA/MqnD/SBP family protein, partial [Acinetobacter baumannii]
AVRRSVAYALAHPEEALDYMRAHAQELSDEVIWAHVHTYVNACSLDVGDEGARAGAHLFAAAEARGLAAPSPRPLFV